MVFFEKKRYLKILCFFSSFWYDKENGNGAIQGIIFGWEGRTQGYHEDNHIF